MKKIIKVIGIVDSIALIITGIMYFMFDYHLTPILPILLGILMVCIVFNRKNKY